jgi:hypothetical protein
MVNNNLERPLFLIQAYLIIPILINLDDDLRNKILFKS